MLKRGWAGRLPIRQPLAVPQVPPPLSFGSGTRLISHGRSDGRISGKATTDLPEDLRDNRRYESHRAVLLADGGAVLQEGHDYFIIWGYWNGPDEKLAALDGEYYEGKNALQALRSGMLEEAQYLQMMHKYEGMLAAAGLEDLNPRGSHILLSLDSTKEFVRDERGDVEVRICNFELLHRRSS